MKTIKMPANQAEFRRAMQHARHEAVVLTQRGKAIAAMVPLEDADAETLSLSTNRTFLGILRQSFKQLDTGRVVSFEEMQRRVLRPRKRQPR
jgi:hypothetical protein